MKSNDIDHSEHTSFPGTCSVEGIGHRSRYYREIQKSRPLFSPSSRTFHWKAPLRNVQQKNASHDLLLASVSSLLSSGQNSVVGHTLPRQS